MEKVRKILPDAELTMYKFANGNNVTMCLKKNVADLWTCEIGWYFGEKCRKDWLIKDDMLMRKDTFNKIKLYELTNLYKSLKKIKNKSKEIKLLIESLIIINHDIKDEIFVEQTLPF